MEDHLESIWCYLMFEQPQETNNSNQKALTVLHCLASTDKKLNKEIYSIFKQFYYFELNFAFLTLLGPSFEASLKA